MSGIDAGPPAGIGVGIVGPGAMAGGHAHALQQLGARLLAVAGPDEEQTRQFAERYGVAAAYPDIGALLAHPGLDAVLICSPSDRHAEQTLAALGAGLPVLCEVPAATSLADAERVAAAAVAADRPVMVAHTLRFCAPHRRVRSMIDAGELDLRHIVARDLTLRHKNANIHGVPRTWVDDVRWHHGSHLVDVALWLLDAPSAISRGAAGRVWPGSGRPMDFAAVLVAPDGDLATLCLSYHSRLRMRETLLIAEDSTWMISGGALRRGDEVVLDIGSPEVMEAGGVLAQDREFIEAIVQSRMPASSIFDNVATLRCLDAVISSA